MTNFACIFFSILCLAGVPGSLAAQDKTRPEALWSIIESRLDQHPPDTSLQFMLLLVRGHCDRDDDYLRTTYQTVMQNLERKFNLPAAICVGEELVKIAQKQQDAKTEAEARLNLYRFHDALGNSRKAAINIEKALRLFEQTGNQRRAALCKLWKLNSSLKYRKIEEVLPAIEALLDEATARGDSEIIIRVHKDLANLTQAAGQYEKMAKHLDALEAVANPAPATIDEKHLWMTILVGRGDLCRQKGAFEAAKGFYADALRLSADVSNRWLEVKCLQILAETEWELGNRLSAKSYLDRAYTYSETLKLDDLLTHCFQVKARFAEAEGRYADALGFTKKMYAHRDSLSNRGSGNHAQNYFLEVEKENQGLELSLKNTQLHYTLALSILILLLAAGFFIGFCKQRQGKRTLAKQNTIIRQQAERLESLDAAKSRFFANVSHELRTPLTLMLGPIQTLLKENRLTDKQARLLQLAGQSGNQLEQLVAEILDLKKLELGKMGLDEKPTGLAPFFRNYFMQFESLAQLKKIDYSFDIRMNTQLAAMIDQPKCRQVLYNLLSNAFKFTPAGGSIAADISVNDGILRLTVADSGPGIHPDDLPHVFDRFFQTTRPDKPAEGGTGIGLNLCQEYARLFGGTIDVESAPGEGSVFRVAFPVKPADMYSETPVSHPLYSETPVSLPVYGETGVSPYNNNEGGSKPTILVVEDNPDLQEYIRLILSEKYDVVTAENGRAALDCLLQTAGCQLILSDLMMPVMDGYQLLEKLKSDDATRHIPVIMLTARADVQGKLKALRIGVDDYLLKPFDEEELLARIENLLKNQAARHEAAPAEPEPGESTPALSTTDREWLETFETYVRKHFADDTLSVSGLAHEFAMSDSTLLRQLKRLTGLSPVQYLQEVRLSEARRLLENRTCDSIATIASKVGYDDARSFSRSFKQRFGKLPSEMMGE
ncbi:MAG: response regulator [Saprospiraceae bacterium]|nr:response regulator [Saprospiraceae bacterium]